LSVRELWIVAVNFKRIVLGSIIGAGFLAGVFSLFIPNQYTAVTTVLPPQQNSSIGSLLAAQMGGLASLGSIAGGSLGLKDPNEIYISMLESRSLEEALAYQFHLAAVYHTKKMSLTLKDLEKHSTILSTKNGLISISVRDRDPNRAAEIANAYVKRLQGLMSTFAVGEAAQRRKFFDQQYHDAQGNLVLAQQRLKDTQQQTGVMQLDAQMRATIESVSQIKAQIAAKEVELQALSSYATSENPERVLAEQELIGLQKQLGLLEVKPGGAKGDLQVPTTQIPAIGMTYLNEVRDVRYYETISELLARQLEVAKLDEAKQGSILQVLDPAVPPDTKSFPSRALIVALAAFVGLLGSIGFLVSRNLLSIGTESQIGAQFQTR
jgi:uncharacterized protein involved in exopolysaccharide biosynthesis